MSVASCVLMIFGNTTDKSRIGPIADKLTL
jgi:hypothetical protein